MWGIYDNRSCLRCDSLLKFSKVWLEGCGIRRNFHKDTIIITDICTVFQKIWCKNNHLFSRVQDCFQDHIQSACSTDSHDQILCGKFRIETSVEGFCDGLAYILKSCVAHISVKNCRISSVYKLNNCFADAVRCRYTWISEAEVKNLICAIFRTEAISFLKHHTDGGIIFYVGFHFF